MIVRTMRGRPFGSAWIAARPESAWITGSYTRLCAYGPGLAEAADRDVDDVRRSFRTASSPEAHALDRAGAEVLDEHVAARDQPPQRVEAAGALRSIASERLLRFAERNVALAPARFAPRSRTRSPLERLDLDHVRALIREHHRRDRTEIMLVRSRMRTPSSGPGGVGGTVSLLS